MNKKCCNGLLIFALIFSTSNVLAHMEDAPLVTDLIADGGSLVTEIDVGDVLVWNDDEFLYIKIETTDGWCATSTKLHLFLDDVDFTDIPITGSGNPKVGKFDINMDHACAVSYDVPPIPLGEWMVDTQLWIAAHADVQKLIEPDVIRYESAWAVGEEFPGKSWATYFGYVVQEYCCTVIGYAQTACDVNFHFQVYTYEGSTCDIPGQLSVTDVGCTSQQAYWSALIDNPTVEVVDNMAVLVGEVTERHNGLGTAPPLEEELSIKVWDDSPDRFQYKWEGNDYDEPVLDDIEVEISCGDTLCPCFNAGMLLGIGIDYMAQTLPDANCIDALPDGLQLDGTRDGSGSLDFDWIANAVYAPLTPANQCILIDVQNGISIGYADISDAEVAVCMDILLNSQMSFYNSCPAP